MEALQDSLPQISDEIKAELLKNELFAKSNPDSQDTAKVTEMIADAMRLGDGECSAPALRKRVAFLAGSNSPMEIEEIIQRFMPVKPSQEYIRKIETGG